MTIFRTTPRTMQQLIFQLTPGATAPNSPQLPTAPAARHKQVGGAALAAAAAFLRGGNLGAGSLRTAAAALAVTAAAVACCNTVKNNSRRPAAHISQPTLPTLPSQSQFWCGLPRRMASMTLAHNKP